MAQTETEHQTANSQRHTNLDQPRNTEEREGYKRKEARS